MTTCTCPNCNHTFEVNVGSLVGTGRKKTMTPGALAARRENGKKGGRPAKGASSTVAPSKPAPQENV